MTAERRLLGSREQPGRRRFQARKAEPKAAKAERELRPSMSDQIFKRTKRLVRNLMRKQWGPLIGAASRHEKYSQRDWRAWERIQEQALRHWKSYKSGGFGANAVDAEMGERIDLTIDSGCAVCALSVGVASAVGMQELNGDPRGHIAANAERVRQLGFKTLTLKFQNGDVQSLKISVMDKLHNHLMAACKVVAADHKIVLQLEDQGGSFIEDVRSKRWRRILERNGVFVR